MNPANPTLLEVQRTLCQSLLHRADNNAGAYMSADGMDPEERLSIYRNTMEGTLVRALRLAYPAVHRLVGTKFFEGAARLFISQSPPDSSCLDDYGEGFPAFLERLAQAESLAYLTDVARLEWLVNAVLHAPDATPLELSHLAQLDETALGRLRFEPHPAARLFRSDFPVDAIWRAVLERDDAGMAAVELASGPVWMLVCRPPTGIEVIRLTESQWHFTAALFDQQPLQRVLEEVPCAEPQLLLAIHMAQGRFVRACTAD